MKTKRIKVGLGWEMNPAIEKLIVQPGRGRYFTPERKGDYTEPRFILPADAASYERMVEQMARAIAHADGYDGKYHFAGFFEHAEGALKSIGITRQRRRGAK